MVKTGQNGDDPVDSSKGMVCISDQGLIAEGAQEPGGSLFPSAPFLEIFGFSFIPVSKHRILAQGDPSAA